MKYRTSIWLDYVEHDHLAQLNYASDHNIKAITLRLYLTTTEIELHNLKDRLKNSGIYINEIEFDVSFLNNNKNILASMIERLASMIIDLNPEKLIFPIDKIYTKEEEAQYLNLIHRLIKTFSKNSIKLVLRPLNGYKITELSSLILNNNLKDKASIFFDPSYLVLTSQPITTNYRISKNLISIIRINDCLNTSDPMLLAEGDCEYTSLFKKLLRDSYKESFSMQSDIFYKLDFINRTQDTKFVSFFRKIVKKNQTKLEEKYSYIRTNIIKKDKVTKEDILYYQLSKLNSLFN